MGEARTRLSWFRAVQLLLLGVLVGVILTGSGVAHLNNDYAHQWNDHLLQRAEKDFYVKALADERYLEASELITRVRERTVNPGGSIGRRVNCPDGYHALGGGAASETNFLDMVASVPRVDRSTNYLADPGTHPAPDGWYAAMQNNDSAEQDYQVVVICAR